MIGAILCFFGKHQPRPGVSPEWSITWDCARCGHLSPGELATKRKRRA